MRSSAVDFMPKVSKYTSRPARSEENRVGQAWRSVAETEEHDGTRVVVGYHHFACFFCGNVVRIDTHGYAACSQCGVIYNDAPQESLIHPYRRDREMAKFAKTLAAPRDGKV